MVTRITKVQAAHTYGVLDKHLTERDDTKFVNGSLAAGRNIILLPQGGYMDRGGTTDFGRLRRKLNLVTYTDVQANLPNGGSDANLLASNTITTGAAAGSRFVLVEIDFGVATNLLSMTIGKVKAATTGGDAALIGEYWTGAAWAAFGAPLLLTTTARSRRIIAGAPGHAGHTATKFRVCVNGTIAAGAISFAGLKLHAETSTLSDATLWRHAPAAEVNCVLAVTEGHCDVYQDGIWRAGFAVPASEAMLRAVKPEARFSSVLSFHQDMEPQIATMLDAVTEWAADAIAFENVPLVDYGGTYVNGVVEGQQIQIYDITAGETFDLTLEGLTTNAITVDASGAVTADAIVAALEALPNVAPGLTRLFSGASLFQIDFNGDGNANREWLVMVGTSLGNDGFVRVRRMRKGKAGGEPIISASAGWPAVGRFAQQRLVMAGLKSRPTDILATVSGSITDLNTELGIATSALAYEVEGSANNAIRDIAVSRTLLFLGDEQVAYLNQTVALSATDAPRFGASDAPGINSSAQTVSSDNALFYVQDGGNTLRLLAYTELEQNYVGDNASVLSAELVKGVKSMTRRRAVGAIDSDLIIMVNSDGTATALTMMRTQEVSGFAPWETQGAYEAAIVSNDNLLWFAVRRIVNGVEEFRLERADPDGLLDEAETRTFAVPGRTIAGLSRFNGRQIWVIAESELFGPFDVSGGTVTLYRDVTGTVTIGSWLAPLATDHQFRPENEAQRRMARLKRVNRVQLSLVGTTHVALSVNGGDVFEVPLTANDDMPFDMGELARPFTGRVEVEGMHGFTTGGQMTVTQLRPGRLLLRAASKDIVA